MSVISHAPGLDEAAGEADVIGGDEPSIIGGTAAGGDAAMPAAGDVAAAGEGEPAAGAAVDVTVMLVAGTPWQAATSTTPAMAASTVGRNESMSKSLRVVDRAIAVPTTIVRVPQVRSHIPNWISLWISLPGMWSADSACS
jgi:hypothetical protein